MTAPTPRRSKRLYRDPIDKKIGGVASGVARYFDIDTTLTRAVWAASVLVGGFGIWAYLILWFILDEDPELLATMSAPAAVEPVSVAEDSEAPAPADEDEAAPTNEDEAAILEEARDEIVEETLEADL
jgi:phage shock protein PspC (stress-responsive transcriptional regulator)